MKLSGQANQYWTNLENRRAARGRPPIDTWYRMKEELKTKYVPPLFIAHLMNNWHQYTQSNKSAKEYVRKFDEFLIRCSILHREGEVQFFSRFRASLRDDLRTELLARRVNELEAAYVLVQDLYSAKITHTFKSHDYRASVSRPFSYPQPNRSSTQPLHRGMMSRVRVSNKTTEIRASNPSKLVQQPTATNAKVTEI